MEAEKLVKAGEYVSFSDLVRDSLRNVIEKVELDRIYAETKKELREGKAIVLRNKKDVDNFMKSIR